MQTKTTRFLLCSVLAASWITSALSQEPASAQPDARVTKIFDQAKLPYKINENGDINFVNGISGRTQLVTVNSKTTKLGSMELREVWSIGFKSTDKVSKDLAHQLLLENAKASLGAWAIGKLNGKEMAVFRANIPADASEQTLLFHVQAISETADAKEKDLVKTDDL